MRGMDRMTISISRVAIVGTGDYARALAKRLVANGISVTIGSRYPDKRRNQARDDILTKVPLVSIQECIQSSDVIVVALRPQHYVTLSSVARYLTNKILIDVSNPTSASQKSNAEILQERFPKSFVVKSLNTVSAYALQSPTPSQRTISVCGNNPDARQVVIQLVNRLGYVGVDGGSLEGARRLEQVNRQFFPGWGLATLVMLIVASLWTIYAAIRYYLIVEPPLPWYRMFSNVFSKVFACIAITLLALTYIPGPIAALKQLSSGTKHRRFPRSLSTFLMMRKQLGLYALLFGILHAVMSIAMLNSAYNGSWFEKKTIIIQLNGTNDIEVAIDSQLSWKGEICELLGVLTVVGLAILGITSINSVSNSFNWREWQCVHSHYGFVVLFLAVAHVTVHAAPGWKTDPFSEVVTKLSFLSVPLPMFALLLKIIILLPCVYIPVQRIRNGWERDDKANLSDADNTMSRDPMLPNRQLQRTNTGYPAYKNEPTSYINRIMHTTEV